MPCNLVILGINFDIDSFIAETKLRGFSKHYKGDLMFKSQLQGRKLLHSSVRIQTSEAPFDNLDKQIKDTILYLKRHRQKLSLIKKTKGIDLALLDFGISLRIDNETTIIQSERLPKALLSLAGEIGLDIELSIYPCDLEQTLKRKSK